jgi:hypothetical protein
MTERKGGEEVALLLVVMWWAVSIPVAVVVGRWIRGTPTPSTAGWVDDPHLATRLQELRAESEMVARSLGLTSQGVTATPSLTRE